MGFDTCQHFFDLKGLGHVVHATRSKCADFAFRIGECADKNDRDFVQRGIVFELLAQGETIHLWHHDVQQNEVGGLLLCRFQCQPRLREKLHAPALAAQHIPQ